MHCSTASTRSGASTAIQQPSNQWSSQNKVLEAFPTEQTIEASKKALEMVSTLVVEWKETLELSARLNNSHLSQSDKPVGLRSGTPSPPRCKGFCTCDQTTVHLPPCTKSVPDQRNARVILMRALRTHPGNSTMRAMCT
jgi:hypothetical protein